MTLDPRPSDAQLLAMRDAKASPAPHRRGNGKTSIKPRLNDPIDPCERMNKTERIRARELEVKRCAGLIRSWHFEAIALILAGRTRYHPDFLVVERDGSITIEEVKGFMRDDAAVKIKVAARQYPFWTFQLFRHKPAKKGGGWYVETVKP